MEKVNTKEIGERIFSLIGSEYESDAAFERALGLKDKTVNNWRRGRSASYMKMLPRLCEVFHVSVSDLLNMPLKSERAELSEAELHLLHLYRRSRTLPKAQREALAKTLEGVITLYLETQGVNKEIKKQKAKESKQ